MSAFPQQVMAAATGFQVHRSGHRKDFAIVVQRQHGRQHGPTLDRCLHHDHSPGQAGDQTVAPWEVVFQRRRARGEFRHRAAFFLQSVPQAAMRGRVHPIAPGGHDSHAPALDRQGAAMGLTVYAQRQAADDDPAVRRQFTGYGSGHGQTPSRCPAGSHHGD